MGLDPQKPPDAGPYLGGSRKTRFLVLGASILLILLVIVVGVIVSRSQRQRAAPASSITPEEQKAVDAANALAKQNWTKISTLSVECVGFLLVEDPNRSGKDELRIDVREQHNAKCGGDPMTAPHVTTLTVKLGSGKVSYEAFVEGEFKDVPLN